MQLTSSAYRKLTAVNDVSTIVEELLASKQFSIINGRKIKHYKKCKDLFKTEQKKKCIEWMVGRLMFLCR